MDAIYGWVRNLVCFYIFMTAVLHLLPRESYRKYVRFFTGLLLVILVVSPVAKAFGKEDMLKNRMEQAGFFQELDNLKLDTAYMEQTQKDLYKKEYERAIETDIRQMARTRDFTVHRAEVELTEEYGISGIYLEVGFAGERDASRQKMQSVGSGDYPPVEELKRELEEFYKIGEGQVDIRVHGGT